MVPHTFVVTLSLLAAVGSVAPADGSFSGPEAQTECGQVSGVRNSTLSVDAYLGIKYGASPTGARRFADTVSLRDAGECWAPQVWNATSFRDFCVQSGQFQQGGSEDCLFLNVWMPTDAHNAPVMVYSYGGDLTDGRTNTYAMGILARETGAVVVSMNYRVNIFGFLAAGALSRTSAKKGGRPSSGNYGFTDQIEALRWVQRNIRSFGGDPSRVMFFG